MRRHLRVSENAAAQIREAVRWCRANRAARELLSAEISRGFDLIRSHPNIAPPAVSPADLTHLRRLHLPRVRYFIYYRPVEPDVIEVLALWHTSRGTSPEL